MCVGISVFNSSNRISPVFSSSILDKSCRIILKDEGIYPLIPECIPSLRTSTFSVPPINPLKEFVVQKRL